MMRTLVLDTETVADVGLARQVSGLADASPDEVMAQVAPPRSAGERFGFPKPMYHRVVSVAIALFAADGALEAFKALGDGDEREALTAFWAGFEAALRGGPLRIVSFNGRRFDMPVLVQRALRCRVSPAPYFRGDYRNRYRQSHLDLADWFANYGSATTLSQHELATLLGLPGKLGVAGDDVAALHAGGQQARIDAYCMCDVATLALAYARLGPLAGACDEAEAAKLESDMRAAVSELRTRDGLFGDFLDALAV